MIDIKVKIEDTTKAVEKAVDKAAFKNFGHAANRIMKDARDSIEKAPVIPRAKQPRRKKGQPKPKRTRPMTVPSKAGTPPNTRRGQIKRAIAYAANKDGAVIGPQYSRFGTAGEAHEFGGRYKEQDYPERPFMGPALERNQARFAADWQNSVT